MITLDTKLDSTSYSKSSFPYLLDDMGLVAIKENDSWSFTKWQWDKAKTNTEGTVCFYKDFGEKDFLLLPQIEDTFNLESQQYQETMLLVIDCLNAMLLKKIDFTPMGAGSIYIEKDKDGSFKTSLVFLPARIYQNCLSLFSVSSYNKSYGYYINPLCHDRIKSIRFMQAVIAYRLLCGSFPYQEVDIARRTSAMQDADFVLVNHIVLNIDSSLAESLNTALKCGNLVQNIESALVAKSQDLERVSQADFRKKYKRFYQKKHIMLAIKHFAQRNKTQLIASGTVATLLLIFMASWCKNLLSLPTTLSLNAVQTVQAFYAGIDRMDTVLVRATTCDNVQKDYTIMTAGTYIQNRSRSTMDESEGTFNLEEWLYFDTNSDYWLYGITNFRIGGEAFLLETALPRVGDFPKKYTPLETGAVVFYVEYDLVQSANKDKITVYHKQDVVTLSYKNNRYKVAKVEGVGKGKTLSRKEIKQSWYELKSSDTQATTSEICRKLKSQNKEFSWLPTKEEMLFYASDCVAKYNNTNAKLDLNAAGIPY